MNLNVKRALIRAVIIALLTLVLIVALTIKAGTESHSQEPQATTEEIPAEETTQEPVAATEPALTTPTQEETTPNTELSTIATEPPTEPIVIATEPPVVEETEPITIDTEPTGPEQTIETEPAEPEPTIETEPTEPEPTTPDSTVEWKSLGTYKLTAYCSCQKCCGKYALNRPTDEYGNPIVYTASGAIAQVGVTIAVDPRIIPYGSSVKINGHIYIAQDTGGAIKGNRIDVYFSNHQEALKFGVQYAEVFILA